MMTKNPQRIQRKRKEKGDTTRNEKGVDCLGNIIYSGLFFSQSDLFGSDSSDDDDEDKVAVIFY